MAEALNSPGGMSTTMSTGNFPTQNKNWKQTLTTQYHFAADRTGSSTHGQTMKPAEGLGRGNPKMPPLQMSTGYQPL